jgi:cobalt/nickel transport system permease protein
MLALDTVAYTSPWRQRHPAEKALLSLGLLTCAVTLPPWPGAPIIAAVAVATALGPARLPAGVLIRAARTPLAFLASGVLPLLVTLGGADLIAWNPAGPAAAARLGARAVAALLCLLLFAATTPLAEILPRLQHIGIPPAITEIAALTYRILFALLDSARAVREAQAARLGYRTLSATYRSLAGQGTAIFIRAFDRARRVEEGLALRGYTGSLQVDVVVRRVSPLFVAVSLLTLAAVIATTLNLRSAL